MTHAQAVDQHAAERYLLDEMPELERYTFEAHFFDCAECAEDVRTGALMREGVAAGLMPAVAVSTAHAASAAPAVPSGRPPRPPAGAPACRGPSPRCWPSPWGISPCGWCRDFAIRASLTQALTPVTLRAATRGAETAIARPTSGVITFALDVNGVPADTRLAYDLRTADGSSVASGTAVAPSPGTPLLLLVPGSAVRAAGSYVLTVRPGDGAASAPVDYRFTLTEQ